MRVLRHPAARTHDSDASIACFKVRQHHGPRLAGFASPRSEQDGRVVFDAFRFSEDPGHRTLTEPANKILIESGAGRCDSQTHCKFGQLQGIRLQNITRSLARNINLPWLIQPPIMHSPLEVPLESGKLSPTCVPRTDRLYLVGTNWNGERAAERI
jgi:hypothetical protein